MRFVYNDPYALRSAVDQLAGQAPIGTRRGRDLPIPIDGHQQGNETVIEGALPGAELKDLELTCEEGLLTVRDEVAPGRRQRVAHTIKVEVGKPGESSRVTMEIPEVLDAVKGQGYREVETRSNPRKGRSK